MFERLENTEIMNFPITSAASKSSGDICTIETMKGHMAFHLAIPRMLLWSLFICSWVMSVKLIDINIKEAFGITLFDITKHKPRFPTLDLLFRWLVSSSGMFSYHLQTITSMVVFHLKYRGNVCSLKARHKIFI